MRMNRHHNVRWRLEAGILLLVVTMGGLALASNMGFKLNFGAINAINKLLRGSGISLTVHDDNNPQKTLVLNLNPGDTQNSNMGFKLNILSVPADGMPVQTPNGNQYVLKKTVVAAGKEVYALTPVVP